MSFRQILFAFFAVSLLAVSIRAGAADGTLLIANREGGSISLVDLPTGTEIARLPIGPVIPHEMAASPDGRWAVTSEYGTGTSPGRHVVVIDVAGAAIVQRIDLGPDSRPHSLDFLADSRHVIVTLELSEEIALVDIIDGEVVRRWPTGGQDSHMVRLAPDDSRAYVAARGGEGTLSVVWLDEIRPPTVIPTGAGAEGIAVSPDGGSVWVANRDAGTLSVFDTEQLAIRAELDVPPGNRVEFLENGQAAFPGGTNDDESVRYVTLFEPGSLKVVDRLEFGASNAGGTGIRLLAANGLLFIADSALNAISVFDPDTGLGPQPIAINTDNPDGMAWSPLRVTVLEDQ